MSALRLSQIGEEALIRKIRRWVPRPGKMPGGLRDDAAVLPLNKSEYLLATVDTSVDRVDFRVAKDPAEGIGWKVLGQNLSDIIAMGGKPQYALISLGLPRHFSVSWVKKFHSGVRKLAGRFGVKVVGGDLSRAGRFFASIILIGKVKKKDLILREGAKPGDSVFVTGALGGAMMGRQFTFRPRLREMDFLRRRFRVNAMIDVSDGLIKDLGHIAEESRVGARVFLDRIPVSRDARRQAGRTKRSALRYALTAGEDYELIFTVPERDARKIVALRRGLAGTKVTRVGKIVAGKGLRLQESETDPSVRELRWRGYTHF